MTYLAGTVGSQIAVNNTATLLDNLKSQVNIAEEHVLKLREAITILEANPDLLLVVDALRRANLIY
jgi:hypothetical protein